MALFNDTYCQIWDRFITKERWKKHLYSSRHIHRKVNGYWPAFFPQRKLTRDEDMKLEKVFWEMIFVTVECVEVYDFLKTYFRMCTNIYDYVPVRPLFDDPDEEEQWGCGCRDHMMAQFKQDLYNKNFTPKDQGEVYEIDTLQKRIKFWINVISNARGSGPDNLYDYDYNDEGLDETVRGAEIIPERTELKKLLDILKSK